MEGCEDHKYGGARGDGVLIKFRGHTEWGYGKIPGEVEGLSLAIPDWWWGMAPGLVSSMSGG